MRKKLGGTVAFLFLNLLNLFHNFYKLSLNTNINISYPNFEQKELKKKK